MAKVPSRASASAIPRAIYEGDWKRMTNAGSAQRLKLMEMFCDRLNRAGGHMTTETAKANIGAYFSLKEYRCKVLKVDSFNGTIHYGFATVLKHGDAMDSPIVGWIPADIIGGCEYGL